MTKPPVLTILEVSWLRSNASHSAARGVYWSCRLTEFEVIGPDLPGADNGCEGQAPEIKKRWLKSILRVSYPAFTTVAMF
jgi:hypothetical protein